MRALADLYFDQGKHRQAMVVYRKLMALSPGSEQLCAWQVRVVRCSLASRDKAGQLVEARRLIAAHGLLKKRQAASKADAKLLATCKQDTAGMLRELATTWHGEAQRTQNEETYRLARLAYEAYLENFSADKDSVKMRYYYAELLYRLQEWELAAGQYTVVVHSRPDNALLADAAYAAVLSWKNALNMGEEVNDAEATPTGSGQDKLHKPLPIPPRQRKMLQAFDTYLKHVPAAPELVAILYRKGRIYYLHNHHDEAVKIFAQVATKYPEHELAVYAANQLLDALNIMGRHKELDGWIGRFLADKKLGQGSFKDELRQLRCQVRRKEAEGLHKQGEYKTCGQKYAAVANACPKDPKWAEVVYNAALCFEEARLMGQAISIRDTLVKAKPDHPLAQRALYMIGANYHALAWYSRAAHYYERFARAFPGEPEAPGALQNAIVFRLGRGEDDEAVAGSRLFEQKYGSRPRLRPLAAAVNFSLGALYEHRQDWDAVVSHYRSYLKRWGRHGGLHRRVQAEAKIGEVLWRRSCPVAGVGGACVKVKRVRTRRGLSRSRRRGGVEVPLQCGPETKMKVTIIRRDPRRSRAGQAAFKRALTLYALARGKSVTDGDEAQRERAVAATSHAAASARFHQAEGQFEDFLRVKFPGGLDFSPGRSAAQRRRAARSREAFSRYLKDKGARLAAARKVYLDVIKLKEAHWAIAAAARVGQLFQNFADALYTAPIPRPNIPAGLTHKEDRETFVTTYVDTYCGMLEREAAKLEARAIDGLATCLRKSTELSWYNRWSAMCERELNQIQPSVYPLAAEIRAEPGYVSARLDLAKPMSGPGKIKGRR